MDGFEVGEPEFRRWEYYYYFINKVRGPRGSRMTYGKEKGYWEGF